MNVAIHSESPPPQGTYPASLFMHHLQSHLCPRVSIAGEGKEGEYLRCHYFHTIQQKVLGVAGDNSPHPDLL